MTLTIPASVEAKLFTAAADGFDFVYVCQVSFAAPVGTKYYATRAISIGGNAYLPKMIGAPQISAMIDARGLDTSPINEPLTLRLSNIPEGAEGEGDTERLEDLKNRVGLAGVLVKVGWTDGRLTSPGDSDIKWDGLYRVQHVRTSTYVMELYMTDASFQPGQKVIGAAITDTDWPVAPEASYNEVRGPIFGKCDTVTMIPVEVGQTATLASEIDDADLVIDLTGDVSRWPLNGYVDIEDERIQFVNLDKSLKRMNVLQRGAGFPGTVQVGHAVGATVTELFSGKTALLGSDNGPSSLELQSVPSGWPVPGVVLIDSECIRYSATSGSSLIALQRGVAMPTVPAVHSAGTVVRTVPVVGSEARYRYVLAEGAATASNFRAYDSEGNEVSMDTSGITQSSVTTPSGKVFTVVDVPRRIRVEKFSTSRSTLGNEWAAETDLRTDPATGFALVDGFLRWRKGPACSSNVIAQIPLALDPNAGTQAAILKSASTDRILDLIFDANFDAGLNAPRKKFGRFADARLRLRVQYKKTNADTGNYAIIKNGVTMKSGVIRSPQFQGGASGEGPSGALSVGGEATIPRSRWATSEQSKAFKLANYLTPAWKGQYFDSVGNHIQVYTWINPTIPVPTDWDTQGWSKKYYSEASDGASTSFLCGLWNNNTDSAGTPPTTGSLAGLTTLKLKTTEAFPAPSSKDKFVRFRVTLFNPQFNKGGTIVMTENGPTVTGGVWQDKGFKCRLELYNAGGGRVYQSGELGIGGTNSSGTTVPPAFAVHDVVPPSSVITSGANFQNVQSARIIIDPISGAGTGALVGDVTLELFTIPWIEGQTVNTTVDGSSFFVEGEGGGGTIVTTLPSSIFNQTIALGSVARNWAAANGADPWDFFNDMGLRVELQSSDASQALAVGDVQLEIDYNAPEAEWDPVFVCDADGRTDPTFGTVITDPAWLLSYLIDQAEFYNMNGYRDTTSWTSAQSGTTALGIKVSRVITSEIELRQLASQLAGENRLVLLFDQGKFFLRFRSETIPSGGTEFGDVSDDALRILSDDFVKEQRLEELKNQLGCYYRWNPVVGDYRARLQVDNAQSQARFGVKREPVNFEWQQSARGYGSADLQRAMVMSLANYKLGLASIVWDYATLEVSAAAAEKMQRLDTVRVHRPRANLYNVPSRVIRKTRQDLAGRHQVTVQMLPASSDYYWKYDNNTYIRALAGGAMLEFVVDGVRQMLVDSAGMVLLKAGLSLVAAAATGYVGATGTPANDAIRYDGGIVLFRTVSGTTERLLRLGSTCVLYGTAVGGSGLRGARLDVDLGGTTSQGLCAQHGDNLDIVAGSQVQVRIGTGRLDARGGIRTTGLD